VCGHAGKIKADRHRPGGTQAIRVQEPCAAGTVAAGEATDNVDTQPVGTIEHPFDLHAVRVREDDEGLRILRQVLGVLELDHRGGAVRQRGREQADRRLALRLLADADHTARNHGTREGGSGKTAAKCPPHGIGLITEMIRGGYDDQRRRSAIEFEVDVIGGNGDRRDGVGMVRKVRGVAGHRPQA
jgi:hypothetical protein